MSYLEGEEKTGQTPNLLISPRKRWALSVSSPLQILTWNDKFILGSTAQPRPSDLPPGLSNNYFLAASPNGDQFYLGSPQPDGIGLLVHQGNIQETPNGITLTWKEYFRISEDVRGAMAAVDRTNSMLAIVSGTGKVYATSTQCKQDVRLASPEEDQEY